VTGQDSAQTPQSIQSHSSIIMLFIPRHAPALASAGLGSPLQIAALAFVAFGPSEPSPTTDQYFPSRENRLVHKP
jgi:hypothetical protein